MRRLRRRLPALSAPVWRSRPTQNRRAYYDDYDGYGGPVYYGGGPVYYGGPGYYGPAMATTAEVPSLAATLPN